jgi:hypothetical protein
LAVLQAAVGAAVMFAGGGAAPTLLLLCQPEALVKGEPVDAPVLLLAAVVGAEPGQGLAVLVLQVSDGFRRAGGVRRGGGGDGVAAVGAAEDSAQGGGGLGVVAALGWLHVSAGGLGGVAVDVGGVGVPASSVI